MNQGRSDGNAGNQGGTAVNQPGNAGNWGGNVRNQCGNEGNQGENLCIGVEMMNIKRGGG